MSLKHTAITKPIGEDTKYSNSQRFSGT